MKKNSKRLSALLFAGCIIISGCGEAENGNNAVRTDTIPANGQSANHTAGSTQDTGFSADSETDTSAGSTADIFADAFTTAFVSESEQISAENPAADTETAETLSAAETAELLNGERHSVVGIITDATKYSVSIQTPTGDSYYLTIPETGVTGNLNYIIVGQMATLTYVGSLDENHAALVGISDSTLVTGIYIEEYAFAIKIMNAVKAMDMKALSDLTNFPVFIDTGNYSGPMNTSGEFEVIDSEKIFTEALVTRMANYNLFDLKYTDSGFVMGDGTPSITFDVDDDGILGIIGINSAAPPAADD